MIWFILYDNIINIFYILITKHFQNLCCHNGFCKLWRRRFLVPSTRALGRDDFCRSCFSSFRICSRSESLHPNIYSIRSESYCMTHTLYQCMTFSTLLTSKPIQASRWHSDQKISNRFCQDPSNSFWSDILSLTEIQDWVPSKVIIYESFLVLFPIIGRVMGVLQRLGISNFVGILTFTSQRLNGCTLFNPSKAIDLDVTWLFRLFEY